MGTLQGTARGHRMMVAHQQSYPQPCWVKSGIRDGNCLYWARLSPPINLMLHTRDCYSFLALESTKWDF